MERETPLNAPLSLLSNFPTNSVKFEQIYDCSVAQETKNTPSTNAFQMMLKKATSVSLPNAKIESTALDTLHNKQVITIDPVITHETEP